MIIFPDGVFSFIKVLKRLIAHGDKGNIVTDNNYFIEGVSTSGVTSSDCSGTIGTDTSVSSGVVGGLNSTQQEDIQYYLTGQGAIDEEYNPLIALVIIVAVMLGVSQFLLQMGAEGNVTLFGMGFAGMLAWFMMVMFGMLPVWTIVLCVVLVGAIAGFKFWNSGNGV